jgi:two-component system repressor protein LuxO
MKTNQLFPVLLIEDNAMVANCYKGFLEDEPIKWVHVETGGAALKYLQKTIPPVILLDLGLPDINGIEIIKYVKQHQLNCAIIVVTGQNAIDVVVKVMRYGIFDFLEKPVQGKRLITTLHQALSAQQNRFPFSSNNNSSPEKIQQYHQFIGASPRCRTFTKALFKSPKALQRY